MLSLRLRQLYTTFTPFLAVLLVLSLPLRADEFDDEFDDEFSEEYSELEESEEISDPFESFNRGMFWFNDHVDMYFFEPVSEGYNYVMPKFAQEGVSNAFENLKYPSYLVSDILQLKFTQAAEHTGRFLINSTVGLAGLIDVAKHFGLERHHEDFGIALANNGVGPGPYLVLPFWGPTTLRDGIGRVVDGFLDPVGWIAYSSADDTDALMITTGSYLLDAVNTRAGLLEAVKAAKEASVDYYLFIQSSYYQNRAGLIHDKSSDDEFQDDFDDEFDDDFDDESALRKELGTQRYMAYLSSMEREPYDWYLQGGQ